MNELITLDIADFWELQARAERVRGIETALVAAREAHAAVITRLVERYSLDPKLTYRIEEATRQLVPVIESTNGNERQAATKARSMKAVQ